MERVERKLQQFDLYKGSRMQRIDHFNCMVPDVKSAHDFYIQELGFRCSEYTETEEEQIWAAWLHRKPTVHDVAFMNGKGPRLHHVGFWLSDPVSVIHTCDVLASLGYASILSGDRVGTDCPMHFSCICGILTVIVWSCTRGITLREIPTFNRFAGIWMIPAAGLSGGTRPIQLV